MAIYKSADSPYRELTWIPTGFSKLDEILGGGVPTRKIFELSGQNSVGKTTLAYHVIANAQKMGMDCLFADTEFSLSGEEYPAKIGVDFKKLDILTAQNAEEVLDEVEGWLSKRKNALVVLDSIGGLLVRQEQEKDASGRVIGGQAKLVATFCRKVTPILAINNCALLVLNHQFTDVMTGKLKTSGGAKLEYSKSIWLMLRKANKRVMKGELQVGDVIEAEIRKHKLAATNKQSCELTLIYGEGFSGSSSLLEEAMSKGLITKEGQFYFFQGEKIGRGLNGVRESLKSDSLAAKIKELL